MELSFQEIQEKLDEYRLQRNKVEAAVKKNLEKTQDEDLKNKREKELEKLLNDIDKAINYHQDLLRVSKNSLENYYGSLRLKAEDIGKRCNLYYEKDKKWYPGEINSVNVPDQTAEVTFFGFSERFQVPSSYIQILIPPKAKDLQEGLDVEVLLQDGKWHYANIENIKEGNITVKLARWGHKHELPLDAIRLVSEEKKPLIEKDVFVMPEKLKILPNDPEKVREKKKKKIKALRNAWRLSQVEKETKLYVSSWKSFQNKGFVKKDSIFKSPEGVNTKIGVFNNGLKTNTSQVKINPNQLKKQLNDANEDSPGEA